MFTDLILKTIDKIMFAYIFLLSISRRFFMKRMKRSLFFVFSLFFVSLSLDATIAEDFSDKVVKNFLDFPAAPTLEAIDALLPKTPKEVHRMLEDVKSEALVSLESLYNISAEDRTFENTLKAFDRLRGAYEIRASLIGMLAISHPEEKMRKAALSATKELDNFSIDNFLGNRAFYESYKEYEEAYGCKEVLNEQQRYFLEDLRKAFKKMGFHLTEKDFIEFVRLEKEIANLELEFERNCRDDAHCIRVRREELLGLSETFIETLERDGEEYVLGIDCPTYFYAMASCQKESCREKLYVAFNQRAYPENTPVMRNLVSKRSELAALLGYDTFSSMDIDGTMANDISVVSAFIDELVPLAQAKAAKEFELITADLPQGVELADGKIKPWDFLYLEDDYMKKTFGVDEELIKEYFSLENTIKGFFSICERFFGVKMRIVDAPGIWDNAVQMVEITKNGELLGHVILDLFPREGKYNHACCATVASRYIRNASVDPAFAIALCNFPKPSDEQPSLLRFDDVRTFFHEFGHALHGIFSHCEITGYAGTGTKRDFVEMPSQILEEWLSDKETFSLISKHYKTGEALSEDLIEKKIASLNAMAGFSTLMQLSLAKYSLEIFQRESVEDPQVMMNELRKEWLPYVSLEERSQKVCSFGHLASGSYASKYYVYMWSKVLALDVFDVIKNKNGLLDSHVGERYIRCILAPGGSKDPNDLLENFLGRRPSNAAFLRSIGL